MERRVEMTELQARVRQHNELAAKYNIQIDNLRQEAERDADVWEILLQQMFLQCINGGSDESPLPEPVLRAALDFGFQCMGVGAVMAIDGLAQETIVI